jgi:hypothetical protein
MIRPISGIGVRNLPIPSTPPNNSMLLTALRAAADAER